MTREQEKNKKKGLKFKQKATPESTQHSICLNFIAFILESEDITKYLFWDCPKLDLIFL